jgi:hypothetical protein
MQKAELAPPFLFEPHGEKGYEGRNFFKPNISPEVIP